MTDLGVPVDEIFLDFAKAFDKVPHQRLLYKLNKYGIKGDLLCWIESFLCNRKQRVKIKNTLSNPLDVLSGVPQGSILGPILFLVYINDLPSLISSQNNIFADDTKLFTKVEHVNEADALQQDLNNITEWCSTWGMVLNIDKCHILHYGKKNHAFLYHLNGRLLSCSNEEKDLGIHISNDLKAAHHISKCILKANSALGMIRRTFTKITEAIFLKVYKVYVRPILEYCQEIWSPHYEKDIIEIEKVQRRATKMVSGMYDLDYEERLKRLNLFKLSERRMRGDMISVYKILNNLTDVDNTPIFSMSSTNNILSTRSHNMKIGSEKLPNTEIRRNFFSHRVVVPWNSLPPEVVNSPNVNIFKGNYDRMVLNKAKN